VYGNSNTFSKNIIDYVGKNGIMLNDSVCIVEKNIISRFGQTSSDLGGIYTAGINNKRHVIRNNFTFGGVSYLDAWNNGDTGSTNHAADRAAGLYNDIANDDCVWEYNTTYDNDFCGMEHVTGRKQKWRYNVSYKNKRTEMAWMELPSNLNIASYVRPIGWANTNELEGNVLYRAGERAISDPQIMSMYKAQQNLNFISVSKNNKFYNPFRPTQKFISANRSGSYSTTSFEQYVSTYADQGSVLCPTILQQTSSTNVADDRSVLFTNMRDNIRVVGLQGSWYDLDGNTLSSNITIDPWYSKIIIRGANGTYTSVKNITHDDKSMLEIFPNPAKAFVNIKINNILPTNAKLYITDMLGKAIKIIALSASDNILQVPLSDFQSGMYYVGLVGVQKSTFQKLVIQ
jgi:hypothetical protein